jgi:hypothetical protein
MIRQLFDVLFALTLLVPAAAVILGALAVVIGRVLESESVWSRPLARAERGQRG